VIGSAAASLKWFRDREITPETDPPDNIGNVIVTLEVFAGEELDRQGTAEDLELAELPTQTTGEIEPTVA
jgi:hypothetical protein